MKKKSIKAVQPYIHPGVLNFKMPAFDAWKKRGGKVASSYFPCRCLHGLFFRYELPQMCILEDVRLMFVEPVSIKFDTFPYYASHEVIPMIWDLWPHNYEKMKEWFREHKTKTAIISSKTASEYMKSQFPQMNILFCPEAVDTSVYGEGLELVDRNVDVLEFGRSIGLSFEAKDKVNHICTKVNGEFVFSDVQLKNAMMNAKITICYPQNITNPENSGGLETLTQRYWEAMLSRMVIVGHAPKELVELCGYNPVIEVPALTMGETFNSSVASFVLDVLDNIENYQDLVNKNRETGLMLGDWNYRMKLINKFLVDCGYDIK